MGCRCGERLRRSKTHTHKVELGVYVCFDRQGRTLCNLSNNIFDFFGGGAYLAPAEILHVLLLWSCFADSSTAAWFAFSSYAVVLTDASTAAWLAFASYVG